MPTWNDVPDDIKQRFRPPPSREDFESLEDYEESLGYWQTHVGRNIGIAMQQYAHRQQKLSAATTEKDLRELLAYVRADGRVCPKPVYWDKLFRLLPNRQHTSAGYVPPNPLILGGWWASTDSDKRERLAVHIRWASEHGVLSEISSFIMSLSPDQWHHVGQ